MTTAIATSGSPYRGLAAFSETELDALFFFGRERESEVIAANVLASRLTVLYGPSGVGKTSVMRAGAVRRLRAAASEAAVVVHDTWAGDPVAALRDTVARASPDLAPPSPAAPLADALADWTLRRGTELYLLLDQFEELFVYHEAGEPLAEELARVVTRRGLPVNVLISIREDALAELDVFTGRVPNVFGNYLPLDRLDREAARAAIVGPLDRHNELVEGDERVEIEPELVETVLDQVAAGRVAVGSAGQGAAAHAPAVDAIEAPFLQLVMERLWEAERERGSAVLRRSTLAELGGAEAIVRAHLDRAVTALAPAERDVAARIFNHLVTPSGTKIAHGVGDLAQYARISEEELRPILDRLGATRILRPSDGRFEIFHDVLADAVLAWRTKHVARRDLEQRHRRTLAVAVTAFVLVAVMAGVAIFALAQRREARDQARGAQARELAARASVELAIRPQRSLALAVESAELEPTREVEEVLRRGLLEAQLRRTWRVGTPVRLVRYSPDGRLVVAATRNSLVFRDVRGGKRVREVHLDAPALEAQFDSDGSLTVATAGGLRSVDPSSGAQQVVFAAPDRLTGASFAADSSAVATTATGTIVVGLGRGSSRTIRSAARPVRAVLSPGGRTVAIVGRAASGRVETALYDRPSGQMIAALPQRGVRAVEYSSGGELLATASADGTTMLWRPLSGAHVATLDDAGGGITDITFNADGTLLATASSDGGIRVWDVPTRKRLYYFIGHNGAVVGVAFHPNSELLASASADWTGRLWFTGGIEAGRLAARLAAHEGAVTVVAFAPDGRTVATGGDDGTARLWNAEIEQRSRLLARTGERVLAADFSRDGHLVVAATADGQVRTITLNGDAQTILEHGGPVGIAAFASRSGLGLMADESGRATLWRGAMPTSLLHGTPVHAVAFRDDGTLAATGGVDGIVRLWSPSGELRGTLQHGSPVEDVAFALDGRTLATARADGVVSIWDIASGQRLQTLHGHAGRIARVAFSPDSTRIVSAGVDGTAVVWTVGGVRLHTLRGHRQPLTDAAFDPAGARIATASEGPRRNAMLWNARTGRLLHDLVGHFATVSGVDFSGDGRWLVTTGPVAAVLWRTGTGHRLDYVRGHADRLTTASFAPRGYRIVTAARDGTIGAYDCRLCTGVAGLSDLARQRLATTGG